MITIKIVIFLGDKKAEKVNKINSIYLQKLCIM